MERERLKGARLKAQGQRAKDKIPILDHQPLATNYQ
jgi:hypothetical protein